MTIETLKTIDYTYIMFIIKVISERLNGLVFYKDHDKLGLKSFRELND